MKLKESNTLMTDGIAENPISLNSFLTPSVNGIWQEITHTFYDDAFTGSSLGSFIQNNLRNRVATTTYEDNFDNDIGTYQTATHYSYDIMGNVTSMLNENRSLAGINHHLKRVNYDFDLISGKVNRVTYQPNQPDQFIHEYEYDADNRIISVNTSTDGSLWQNDAYYRYHYHGPLARMELGQYRVQGVDYFYTLQGWMKGANSSVSNFEHDMYHDGEPGSLYGQVARDAYAFTLNYYDYDDEANGLTEDYVPINAADPEAYDPNSLFRDGSYALFNGNIRNAIYNLSALKNIYGYAYKYDQLNRLKNMNTYDGLSWTSNEWQPGTTNAGIFNEAVNYDPNGNILGYGRGGDNPSLSMDDLSYNYYPGTNKLQSVFDPVSSSNYPNDIDDNTTFNSGDNYEYDDIGNLTNDHSEGLTVTWYNNGKIKEVINANTNVTINYMYDPAGNRVQKTVNDNSSITHTYYQRDAQGNTLAVYTQKDDDLYLREQHIYGSSRIGMYLANRLMYCTSCPPIDNSLKAITKIGAKRYELTNHLGNVLTTITDKKLAGIGPNGVEYYPQITQATEYYPFGMQMPNRNYVLSGDYRFGFNGKENDSEVKGSGNQQDYGMRIYDTRLGRFLSVDPLAKSFPWNSTYSFAENDVVRNIDLDGLERFNMIINDNSDGGKTVIVVLTSLDNSNGIQVSINGASPIGNFKYAKIQEELKGVYVGRSPSTGEPSLLNKGAEISHINTEFSMRSSGTQTPEFTGRFEGDLGNELPENLRTLSFQTNLSDCKFDGPTAAMYTNEYNIPSSTTGARGSFTFDSKGPERNTFTITNLISGEILYSGSGTNTEGGTVDLPSGGRISISVSGDNTSTSDKFDYNLEVTTTNETVD